MATKLGILEKPWNSQYRLKKSKKTWNLRYFDKKSLKNPVILNKNHWQPGILSILKIKSYETLIPHKIILNRYKNFIIINFFYKITDLK